MSKKVKASHYRQEHENDGYYQKRRGSRFLNTYRFTAISTPIVSSRDP
jgi:hypothetical protein